MEAATDTSVQDAPDTQAAAPRVPSTLDQSFHNSPPPRNLPSSLFDARDALLVPSISMHGDTIAKHESVGEEFAGDVAPAVAALQGLWDATTKTIQARKALADDPTMTEAAKVLMVAAVHEKGMACTKAVDAARATLLTQIKSAEEALRAPLASTTHNALAQEVRNYVRGLKDGERMNLIRTALTEGDLVTAGAVLGCAVPYLSGITKEMQVALTAQWNELRNPTAKRRVEVMRMAVDKLEVAGSAYLGSIDQAIGAKRATVDRLREQQARARKAAGV